MERTSADCPVHHRAQSSRVTWRKFPWTMSTCSFSISRDGDVTVSLGNLYIESRYFCRSSKRNVWGWALFYMQNFKFFFFFNYLNSIPWKRTCNLARKDLMTRMNPAVPVKIKKSSQKGKVGERGLPKFICASQTFLVVFGKTTRFIQILEFTSYQVFQKM